MILDAILIKTFEIVKNFGYISIPILVGFGQILGYPTEVTIPIIVKAIPGIFTLVFVALSDMLSFYLYFYASKPFSDKIINRKIVGKKEIFLYRLVPLVRGGMIPLIASKNDGKELLLIVTITSFLWATLFYLLSFFLDFWKIVHFIREHEKVFLAILFGVVSFKVYKFLKEMVKKGTH